MRRLPKLGRAKKRPTGLLAEVRHRQGRLLGRMESLGFMLQKEAELETLTRSPGRRGMRRIIVSAWRDDGHGPMEAVSGPVGKEQVHYEAPAAPLLEQEMSAFLALFAG